MTPQEYAAWIAQYATSIGLDPALAQSVWQQESSGSLDTALKGPELSRGRGNAIGPWQVVPAYHPDFPVEGDPIAQGQYAMNYLKEVGPARYYGTGQAPPGQPTTDQYVSQVMTRAGRPDVRQASLDPLPGVPTGDPLTGAMDPGQGQHQGTPVQALHQAMAPGPGGNQGTPPTLDALSSAMLELRSGLERPKGPTSPFLSLAVGLLTSGGNIGEAAGLAGQSQMLQEAERAKSAMSWLDQSAKVDKLLSDEEERRARRRWEGSLTPDQRAIAEAGFGAQVVQNLMRPPAAAAAPTTKDIQVGDQTVTLQWDAARNAWQQVATAPRWAPATPTPQSPFGGVPQGMQRIPDPASPTGTRLEAEPGSPQQVERTAKVAPLQAAVERIDGMLSLMDRVGTSQVWGEDAGTMQQRYAQLVSDIANLRGMGVLQPGELVNIESSLTNPTGIKSWVTLPDTIKAQYKELRSNFAGKLKAMGAEVPSAVPPLPPELELIAP